MACAAVVVIVLIGVWIWQIQNSPIAQAPTHTSIEQTSTEEEEESTTEFLTTMKNNKEFTYERQLGKDVFRNNDGVEIVVADPAVKATEEELGPVFCEGSATPCAEEVEQWNSAREEQVAQVQTFLNGGTMKDVFNAHGAFAYSAGGYASMPLKEIVVPTVKGLKTARAVLTSEGQDRSPYLTIRLYGETEAGELMTMTMGVSEELNEQMNDVFNVCVDMMGDEFWQCMESELKRDLAITGGATEQLQDAVATL